MTALLVLVSLALTICITNCETITCLKEKSCQCTQNNECIINCIGEDYCKSSSVTLTCKSAYPCTINCIGTAACGDAYIDGSRATHLNLICNGKDTCKGEGSIECGSGDCTIKCIQRDNGDTCNKHINTNTARSFQCIGNDCPNNVPNQYSLDPTPAPTPSPTPSPTSSPTPSPTMKPTISISNNPPMSSTVTSTHRRIRPTINPSQNPTMHPSISPSSVPTLNPILQTTVAYANISLLPSYNPTSMPFRYPSPTLIVIANNPTQAPVIISTYNNMNDTDTNDGMAQSRQPHIMLLWRYKRYIMYSIFGLLLCLCICWMIVMMRKRRITKHLKHIHRLSIDSQNNYDTHGEHSAMSDNVKYRNICGRKFHSVDSESERESNDEDIEDIISNTTSYKKAIYNLLNEDQQKRLDISVIRKHDNFGDVNEVIGDEYIDVDKLVFNYNATKGALSDINNKRFEDNMKNSTVMQQNILDAIFNEMHHNNRRESTKRSEEEVDDDVKRTKGALSDLSLMNEMMLSDIINDNEK